MKMVSPFNSTHWNIKILLIPPLLMALIFISWLSPLFRPFWDRIDQMTFIYLNGWIKNSVYWQNFWAFTNHKAMDWIHDAIMFSFFYFNITKASTELKSRKIAEVIVVLCFMTLILILVNNFFIHTPRKSPTEIDPSAFRLSSVIEWMKVKDHSKKSFPGDHGTTAILFTCFVFYLMGWKKGIGSIFYAIFFTLPRLISGAHWTTDILIGSALIAIGTTSLIMGSPLGFLTISYLEQRIDVMRDKGKSQCQR